MRAVLIAACLLVMAGGAAAKKNWPKGLDDDYFRCGDHFVTVPLISRYIVSYRKSDIASVHYSVDATGRLSLRFILRANRATVVAVVPKHWKRLIDCLDEGG